MLPLSADDPRVIGEFRLHTRLGAGGMGRVYLASSPGGRAVAVKVIHSHLARDAAFVDRFRREVAAAQAVNGGYAAPVVAAGPDDDPPWLATAYVAGPSLQAAVTETGPLPEAAVLKLAAGLAEALRAIHDGGLVHRDLKPDNVLLAADGPRVIDFGIARALDSTGLTSLTSTGSVLGTPSYMSPEQAQGQPTGPASDVFSLGSVLYFAAAGVGPFGSGTHAVMLYRIVHTKPDLSRLPPRVRDLVASCMAQDPARRPTPAGLAASLMDALPPGDSPPAFWPGPVARLIADHQAGFAARLMAAEPASADAYTLPVAPLNPLPAAPLTPPVRTVEAEPTRVETAGPTRAVPGMGRRRMLAALAGAASAGLVVGVFELTRPGPPVNPDAAADLAARGRATASSPGTQLWSFETNGTVSSVAVSDGVAYVGTLQRAVYALDALTGKLLWRHLMDSGQTYYLAPAGDVVVAANGYNGVEPSGFIGGVYGLDAATGKLLWNTEAQYADGLAVSGDVVYAATPVKSNTTGGLTALSTTTGDVLWTFDFPTSVDVQTGVVASDGMVFTTTTRGEIWALSADSGTVVWHQADPAITFKSSPQVAGGVLYASTGQDTQDNGNPSVYAMEAHTGHVLWQHSVGAGFNAFIGTNGVDDQIFVALNHVAAAKIKGTSELIALNADTGQQLWQIPMNTLLYEVTPTTGNVVYTGSTNGLLDAWQAGTGNHLWSYRAPGAVNSIVAVNDGIAYFGGSGRRVHAVVARS
jgi:outer membrane protein assembly factor BamB